MGRVTLVAYYARYGVKLNYRSGTQCLIDNRCYEHCKLVSVPSQNPIFRCVSLTLTAGCHLGVRPPNTK